MKNLGHLLLVFCAFISAFSFAQEPDSIKQLLRFADNKAERLIEISRAYRDTAPVKSIHYAELAIAEAKKSGDRYIEGMAFGALAMGKKSKGSSTEEIVETFNYALAIFRKDGNKEKEARVLNNIGIEYDVAGEYDKALKYYLDALKLYESIGFTTGIGEASNNVGVIYEILEDYKTAMTYYIKSLEINKKQKDTLGISKTLVNIASVNMNLRHFEEAEKQFAEALKLKSLVGDSLGIALAYNNLAGTQHRLGNSQKAIELFEKAAGINKRIGRLDKYAKNCYNEAYVYDDLKQYSKAIDKALEALEYARQFNDKPLELDLLALLSDLYHYTGNDSKALDYATGVINLSDTLNNIASEELTRQLKEEYESEKNIQLLELEKEKSARSEESRLRTEAESNRKNIVIIAVICIGLLFLVLAYQLFKNNKQKQEANLLLEKQNHEILEQKKIVEEQKDLIEDKHKEITDSINYAKRIQTALLTSDAYWDQISRENFVLFKPRDVVSGDFFWAYETETLQEPISIWCAADCTGHGVPGAFMSMLGISFLNEIVVENGIVQAAEILNKLREKIVKALEQKVGNIQQKDGMDIALCVWHKKSNLLEYAGANNPLWIIRSGEVIEIKADKMPVGNYSGPLTPFNTKPFQLQKDDAIYVFSDGYADQFGGEHGKKFKYAQFKFLLMQIQNITMQDQKNIINERFEEWKGQLEQIDDVCVIGVKV